MAAYPSGGALLVGVLALLWAIVFGLDAAYAEPLRVGASFVAIAAAEAVWWRPSPPRFGAMALLAVVGAVIAGQALLQPASALTSRALPLLAFALQLILAMLAGSLALRRRRTG